MILNRLCRASAANLSGICKLSEPPSMRKRIPYCLFECSIIRLTVQCCMIRRWTLRRGQFGYRKLLYYKDFPGMSKPVFMVSVCSSVKIKGRDCGTINGHDESSSIRALMKDAREVLVR